MVSREKAQNGLSRDDIKIQLPTLPAVLGEVPGSNRLWYWHLATGDITFFRKYSSTSGAMGRPTTSEPASESPRATEFEQLADAQDAVLQEHDLGFWEALRLYPKGVFWSVAMSTACIMEGYDTKLIGTLFAQPAFQKAYGQPAPGNTYQVSAPWQAGLSNGSNVGQLIGLLIAGYISERYALSKDNDCGHVDHHCLHLYHFLCSQPCSTGGWPESFRLVLSRFVLIRLPTRF